MKETRTILLEVAKGDANPTIMVVTTAFCESCVSVQIESSRVTIHIPWTELVEWQRWLAEKSESE